MMYLFACSKAELRNSKQCFSLLNHVTAVRRGVIYYSALSEPTGVAVSTVVMLQLKANSHATRLNMLIS